MLIHVFNPNTWEAEAGLKLAWSIDRDPGQPELHRETLSQTTKKRGKKEFIEDRIKFTNSGSGVRHKLLLKLFL